jgi:hypothetical protein
MMESNGLDGRVLRYVLRTPTVVLLKSESTVVIIVLLSSVLDAGKCCGMIDFIQIYQQHQTVKESQETVVLCTLIGVLQTPYGFVSVPLFEDNMMHISVGLEGLFIYADDILIPEEPHQPC